MVNIGSDGIGKKVIEVKMTEQNPSIPETPEIPENERTYFVLDCLFQIPSAARFLCWARSREDFEKEVLPNYTSLNSLQDHQVVEISREDAAKMMDRENPIDSRELVPSPYSASQNDDEPAVVQ